MLRIEELVAAGANVGGPYVAIPAAALFLAFSVGFYCINEYVYENQLKSRFIKSINPRKMRCSS
jgi:hypothetical protein